jgi:O-glycosyl hydrolase
MKQKLIVAITSITLILAAFICISCPEDVIEAAKPVLFVEPYITTQPASQSYTVGASGVVTELTVEVAEWTAADGSLSFQWYTFENHFKYLKDGGEKIAGATSPTLPLSMVTLKTTANSRNYFYVEITNVNPVAVDRQSGAIRSETAVISFNAVGAPAIPIITRQPADTEARFGRAVTPLSVRARVNAAPANTGDLSYQWYSIDLDSTGAVKDSNNDGYPDATAIAGEIYNVYTPTASRLNESYYYVEVTHTLSGSTAREISVPATVNILLGLRAGAPVISTPPKAALYFGSAAASPLTIAAESPDLGALTFQWYSNTQPIVTGGTLVKTDAIDLEDMNLVDGVNVASSNYTPTVTANHFYYVVVTNTNENVEGAKTATATTRAVNVRRQSTNAPSSANAFIAFPALNSLTRYNYIRGYGGMEVAWANFPETFPEDTELQYDPDQLGYNILRIMLPVSNTNIDLAMEDLTVTTKRRPHYYENVKIVNKHGGYVAAAPWSPPKEWKSNNSINGGGILRHEYYKEYAAYLKAFAMHMNNRGAPIYCISIQNEPNYTAGYDGCEWTPAEMSNFFAQVGRFTEGVRGWGGGKQIPRVLAMNGESANNVNINSTAINNPAAYRNIDLFGRHVYGERGTNLWTLHPAVQQTDNKEVWMTEHNINSANASGYYNDSKWDYIWKFLNDVDLVMRQNNENAFVWWASKRFYSMVGDGQYGTPPGQALPRGWALSHYSKYTIDMTRIGFNITGVTADSTAVADAVNTSVGDMDNISARITAYISQDGNEISMILWTPTTTAGVEGHDMGTIEITMPAGFTIAGATGIQSRKVNNQSNEYQAAYEVLVDSSRTKAYVTLPRSRIISVKFTKE